MNSAHKILVIGGGISGLACAWRLKRLGLPVILMERGRRFGGVISTVERDGFLFDVGPQSFLGAEPIEELIAELGIEEELLRADSRAPRYILHHGKLVAAPLKPQRLVLTPLIGLRTKLRLLSEPFLKSYPPDEDESIAAFVRRKFGADLLANLAAPFVSGVYAGDPERLSLQSAFPGVRQLEERFGSVIRGLMKIRRGARGESAPLCNFVRGLPALIEALETGLGDAAMRGMQILSIRGEAARNEAPFTVSYSDGASTQSFTAAAVVVATPTAEAGQLLGTVDTRFGAVLDQIEYAGVAQVCSGYRKSQVALRIRGDFPNGFGFLVPRSERLRLLGVVWNSCLFPGRAPQTPEPTVSLTGFLGGATDGEICSWPEERIAATARAELAAVMSISGPPIAQHVAVWERALPQYNIGHSRVMGELARLCADSAGVFLAGNYLEGPSVGACVAQAGKTAEAVAKFCGGAV